VEDGIGGRGRWGLRSFETCEGKVGCQLFHTLGNPYMGYLGGVQNGAVFFGALGLRQGWPKGVLVS